MYPSEPTLTEELIQHIENNRPLDKDILKQYIDEFNPQPFQEGEDYYFKKNAITNRNIYKYTNDGQKVIDQDATNNKLASGWHKLLVDQKVGYLVGDPITIGYQEDTDITPLLELLGDDFDDVIPELVKRASNKGKEWLHPYIDPEGNFDYLVVPAQEYIPIYDNTKRKNQIAGIRLIPLDHDDIVKVEYWTDELVYYYEIIRGQIYLDASVEVNPQSHFEYGEQGYGWGKVPFIEFKNNEEGKSDLTFYKDFIDMYDWLMSDSANTLEDVQQFLYEIRGYEGTDMEHAVTNLKRHKGVAVSEDGGVNIIQGDVPMDSINSYLDRLKDDIFQFSQGVDVGTDKFGQSPSGIALKFLFSNLDMKANVLERKFTKALKKFFWFVCEYADITGIGEYDNQKLTFTFNKSMLMNDAEQVDIAQKSVGVISKETIMSNHPWVTDVEAEKERLEEETPDIDLDQPLGEDDE